MRLKIFGISKFGLAFFGLLPSLVWFAFYQKFEWPLGLMLLLALLFPFLFCRGIFQVRYGVWLTLGAELLYEMFQGAQDRDFIRIIRACFVFVVSFGIAQWIEAKVKAASLNPFVHWFEGAPQTLPQGSVRLDLLGESHEGALRRADDHGFFVFMKTKPLFKAGAMVPFELQFKDSSVSGEAKLAACFLGEKIGFGLQFSPKDLYHFNQYTTLVSRMRGEGL